MQVEKSFTIKETLYENDSTIVHRVTFSSDDTHAIIKELKHSYRNEHKIKQFINEEKILSKLDSKYIIHLLGVVAKPSAYYHVFEDIEGTSLYNLIQTHTFHLEEVLQITLSIMEALAYLHKNNIIHADINPHNIIYNTKTKHIQIIDFGLSIKTDELLLDTDKKLNSSGNLFYIAPEQTGLTEYEIDHRSDIYSLGMSLYHLLLGKVPLKADNYEELLHKQIAVIPTLLSELDEKIPHTLSIIIEKMIQKKPSKRYQRDEAILYDLEQCFQSFKQYKTIKSFQIASLDKPAIPIGEVIFGRDEELSILKRAIKASDKQSMRILVSGDGGSGKSKLLEEALKQFTNRENFHILKGKFNQYTGQLAYSAYREIFTQLSSLVSTQEQERYLQKMNAETPKILTSFFPKLETLFHLKQNTVKKPKFSYSQEQLSFAIDDFFLHAATQKHPFILFFDDLQWIEHASSHLLMNSILNSHNTHIHFVATMRDNDNAKSNALLNSLQVITQTEEHPFINIKLKNLYREDIMQMIQTTFATNSHIANHLSTIIYKKTQGNPFYIKTFIEFLLDKKEISFKKGAWFFSLKKIQSHKQLNNVTELVRLKLNQLSKKEKLSLQYLALLGNKFNLLIAIDILQHHNQDSKIIKSLIQYGFIEISSNLYQFSHDLIQQDVLNSITAQERYSIHKKIGLFLELLYKKKKYSNIRSVVYHLNRAYPIKKLPKRLYKLNITATQEMLQINSYELALAQIEWMDEAFTSTDFEHSFLKTKTLYLNSKLKKAQEETSLLLKQAKTNKEKLRTFQLLKDIAVTSGTDFQQIVTIGNDLFKQLELTPPKTKIELREAVNSLSYEIHEHPLFNQPQALLLHATLNNTRLQQISSLLVDYWELAFYLKDINLMRWCYLNLIQISFTHGNSSYSSFGYVLYGSYLIGEKEYKEARAFGEIALKLNNKFHDLQMSPKIHNFVANFINPYTKKISSNINLYEKSLNQSKINGDIVFGTWANFLMHFSSFLSGNSLEKLLIKMKEESAFILNSGDKKMIDIFNILKDNIFELTHQNRDNVNKEKQLLENLTKKKFYPAVAWYAIIKAQNCLITGKIEEGLNILKKYVYSELNEVIMFAKIYLHTIRALLLLQVKGVLKVKQLTQLNEDLAILKSYHEYSPANFKFYKLLLKAELNKTQEIVWDVAKRYDKAIEEAKKEDNAFFIALANLLSSRFWSNLDYIDMKTLYLNEAIVGFHHWGAKNIVTQLKVTLAIPKQENRTTIQNSSIYASSTSRVKQSNFQTLIKSYTALSQSKNTQELVKMFMQIFLQHAMASNGVLILKENDEFFIKAFMDYTHDTMALKNDKLKKQGYLPHTLIQEVLTKKKNIVVTSPSTDEKFQFDPYFQKNNPASSTAIAIKLEGEIQGILYIQNDELSTTLTQESIKTLELLLTQMAIVFKNLSLYESLKLNDANLNKAQELLHVGSWSFNSATREIIWSAETYRIFDMKPFSRDIDYSLFSSFIHPDDLEYVEKSHDKAIEEGSIYYVEHRIITHKGLIKHVVQKAEISIRDGIEKMTGTIQDITQARQTQKQINALSKVIEQSPNSIVITNTFGDVEYANKAFSKITGYTREEMIGSNMNILSSKTQSPAFYEKLWDTLLVKKEIWNGVMLDKAKNDKLIDLQTTIFPILDSKNRVIKLTAIQEDITEKRVKDKLFLLQTRQAQMGEMISMIAHQWRQPLAAISATSISLKMALELQRFDLTTSDGREGQKTYFLTQLGKIDSYVANLSTTIDDFRNFYKPNKKPIQMTFKALVAKSLNIIQTSLKNHNITLIEEYNSEDILEIYDSEMIQVLLNILKNAQDAFDENKIKDATLKITTHNNTISICDNAGGIPEEIIDSIFEVYFSTKSEKNGTGLGLYMAKTIIEKHHNGTICVSNENGGTCFTITLDKASHAPPPIKY